MYKTFDLAATNLHPLHLVFHLTRHTAIPPTSHHTTYTDVYVNVNVLFSKQPFYSMVIMCKVKW